MTLLWGNVLKLKNAFSSKLKIIMTEGIILQLKMKNVAKYYVCIVYTLHSGVQFYYLVGVFPD